MTGSRSAADDVEAAAIRQAPISAAGENFFVFFIRARFDLTWFAGAER